MARELYRHAVSIWYGCLVVSYCAAFFKNGRPLLSVVLLGCSTIPCCHPSNPAEAEQEHKSKTFDEILQPRLGHTHAHALSWISSQPVGQFQTALEMHKE